MPVAAHAIAAGHRDRCGAAGREHAGDERARRGGDVLRHVLVEVQRLAERFGADVGEPTGRAVRTSKFLDDGRQLAQVCGLAAKRGWQVRLEYAGVREGLEY